MLSSPAFAKKAKKNPTTQQSSSNQSYDNTCHIGPRGGRYTITASGNKRYGC